MDEIPEAVRAAYEAEIRRLEQALEGAAGQEATKIKEAIGELEAELLVESWPVDD